MKYLYVYTLYILEIALENADELISQISVCFKPVKRRSLVSHVIYK